MVLLIFRATGVKTDVSRSEGSETTKERKEYLSYEELMEWAEIFIVSEHDDGFLYSPREANELLTHLSPWWQSVGDLKYRERIVTSMRETLGKYYAEEADDAFSEEERAQFLLEAFEQLWILQTDCADPH